MQIQTEHNCSRVVKPFCCLLPLSGSSPPPVSTVEVELDELLKKLQKVRMKGECTFTQKNNCSRMLLKYFQFLIGLSFSTELLHMQPSTAVIINNCYAHWRPQTSVTLPHWHLAFRWRLFSQAVNPGNPAISRHVVRKQLPTALENKHYERKLKKYQVKVNFFLVRVENSNSKTSINFQILLLMQNYRQFFMLRAGFSTLDLHKRQVHGTVQDTTPEFYQPFLIVST